MTTSLKYPFILDKSTSINFKLSIPLDNLPLIFLSNISSLYQYFDTYSIMQKKKAYLRDGRAPIPKDELTSRIMSSIGGKNTKPELILRKALWKEGIRGYRLHWKKAPGRPDISFPGKKIAIFVNGCFWHRCPKCQPPMPKSHSEFWKNKFEKNVIRDKSKIISLKENGWTTHIVWECDIKDDLKKVVAKILKFIGNK